MNAQGLPCDSINKVAEGRPHIVDLIKNGEINYIVNTTEGKQAISDSFSIRREALQHRVVYSTTIPGRESARSSRWTPATIHGSGRYRNCIRKCTDEQHRSADP